MDTGIAIWIGIEFVVGIGLFVMLLVLKKLYLPIVAAIWWTIVYFDRWRYALAQYDLNCDLAYFAMAMIVLSFSTYFYLFAKPKDEKVLDERTDTDKRYDEWSKKKSEHDKRMEMIRGGRPRRRGGWGSDA
jgi:hypothetical protein